MPFWGITTVRPHKAVRIQLAYECLHSHEGPAAVGELVPLRCAAGGGDGAVVKAAGRPDSISSPASLA
jgi:hypothetical protein